MKGALNRIRSIRKWKIGGNFRTRMLNNKVLRRIILYGHTKIKRRRRGRKTTNKIYKMDVESG